VIDPKSQLYLSSAITSDQCIDYDANGARLGFGLDQERFDSLRERDFAMRQNGARQFCRFRIGATAGRRYRFPAMSRAFGGEHVVAFRIWSCFGVRFG